MLAGSKPKRKILLGLDLDYSHFNLRTRDLVWIGGEAFWIELYKNIIASAAEYDVEIVFAVITKKPHFDDVCAEAALKFRQFLEGVLHPVLHPGFHFALPGANIDYSYSCCRSRLIDLYF